MTRRTSTASPCGLAQDNRRPRDGISMIPSHPRTVITIITLILGIFGLLFGFENTEFEIKNNGLVECEFNENVYYFGGLLPPTPPTSTPYPHPPTLPAPNPTPAPTLCRRGKRVVGSENKVFDILEKGLNCEFEIEKSEFGM